MFLRGQERHDNVYGIEIERGGIRSMLKMAACRQLNQRGQLHTIKYSYTGAYPFGPLNELKDFSGGNSKMRYDAGAGSGKGCLAGGPIFNLGDRTRLKHGVRARTL